MKLLLLATAVAAAAAVTSVNQLIEELLEEDLAAEESSAPARLRGSAAATHSQWLLGRGRLTACLVVEGPFFNFGEVLCPLRTSETCETEPAFSGSNEFFFITNLTNYYVPQEQWPADAATSNSLDALVQGILPVVDPTVPTLFVTNGFRNSFLVSEACTWRDAGCPVGSEASARTPLKVLQDNLNVDVPAQGQSFVELITSMCYPTCNQQNAALAPGQVRITRLYGCQVADFKNPLRDGKLTVVTDNVGNKYVNHLRNAGSPEPNAAFLPDGWSMEFLSLPDGFTFRTQPLFAEAGCSADLTPEKPDCLYFILQDASANSYRRFYHVGQEPTGGMEVNGFPGYPPFLPTPSIQKTERCQSLCT